MYNIRIILNYFQSVLTAFSGKDGLPFVATERTFKPVINTQQKK
jgi:hypothetical protein